MNNKTKTLEEIFYGTVDKNNPSGCWVWTACLTNCGYGNVTWKQKNYRAHRLSWLLYYGEIPEGMLVCHKCDNRKCVNPEHLFLGTPKDNTADMIKKGGIIGRKCNANRLSGKDFDDIRQVYAVGGVTQKEIANKYGVSDTHIGKIINFRVFPRKVTE